jgi:hypothetical protein
MEPATRRLGKGGNAWSGGARRLHRVIGDIGDVADEEEDMVSEASAMARTRWAYATIEQCVHNKIGRQSFAEIVDLARQMFLTHEAKAAGAESGRYYTNTALMVRATLSQEPQVLAALRYAWQRCTHAELNIKLASRELGVEVRTVVVGAKDGVDELALSRLACTRSAARTAEHAAHVPALATCAHAWPPSVRALWGG